MLKVFYQHVITILACSVSLLFAYMNTFPPTVKQPLTPPSPTESLIAILSGLIFSTIILSIPLLFKIISTPPILKAWFHLPKITLRRCIVGIGLFLLLYFSTYLIYIVLNPANVQTNLSFILLLPEAPIGLVILIGLFICVIFPLAEELLYRGLILRAFPPMLGLVISTLLFAFAHGINGYLFPILLIGWGLGLLALNTRSILPSFLCHVAFNALNFIFLFI